VRRWLAIALLGSAFAAALPVAAQFEANRRPPRPNVTLPDGPARQVILRRCSACHGIDEYGYYAMDRAHWSAVIERMKTATSGVVVGTAITDDEADALLDWLETEFGPDTEPFERIYVIPELGPDERLTDAAARALLADGCTECHSLDTVYGAELDADAWRARVTREIGRGAGVLIAAAEPLVQWLSAER